MAELLFVSEDNQTLSGTDENDSIQAVGFTGTTIQGLAGNDELFAGTNGLLSGGAGNDFLQGTTGGGGNILNGDAGDDSLFGNNNDILKGGDGADRLFTTGSGGNTYTGDAGSDQFWLAISQIPTTPNLVTDFTQGEDVLGIGGLSRIAESFEDLTIDQAEGNTNISVEGGATSIVTLEGFTDNLSAEDFVVVGDQAQVNAPEFEGEPFQFDLNPEEAGEFSATINARDPNDDPITFSITEGNDPDGNGTDAFAIDDSGVITVADAAELEGQTIFDLTVEASDGELASTSDVTINLQGESPTGSILDIDGNGNVTVTDGRLAFNFLSVAGSPFIDPEPLVEGIVQGALDLDAAGAIRTTGEDIVNFIEENQLELDIDGNGNVTVTDGRLAFNFLSVAGSPFIDPEPLVEGIVQGALDLDAAGATRTTGEEIVSFIEGLI
jgi:hypothetical protein